MRMLCFYVFPESVDKQTRLEAGVYVSPSGEVGYIVGFLSCDEAISFFKEYGGMIFTKNFTEV